MTAASTTQNKENEKFADLIGPTDPAVDRASREKLIGARVGLLLNSPFFGNMATRLQLTNADDWCSTAATDGRNFYYNSRFVEMLKGKELEFLFGHEVLHCCYDHFGRRGDRHPMLWNIADDYAVNSDLIKSKVGTRITTVPCLYDPKFDGMCSEEIYDHLYENAEKIDMNKLIEQMIDEHIDGDGEESEGENGKGKPKLSKEERDKIREELKEAMLGAAEQAGAGNTPAGVKRLIKAFTEPKMNWRELLRQHIESTIKTDFSWMRPSRRGWHMDSVMPGMTNGETTDVVVAIDTSGSISETMLRDFLSEIKGIMEEFEQFRIHLFTFDTDVYNPVTYTSETLDNIEDYEVNGFGGTDFTAIFNYLKNETMEPQRLVVFTDGYPWGSWGDPDYCDTLWIIHGTREVEAPFGITVYYDDAVKN